jgi:hypothetical protein
MCVDYTDLNKHCPKDHFRLPCIDQVVDSTVGCVLLCFLDCYLGYHQIALKADPCCFVALMILALSSELMLWNLWFHVEILCSTCSNKSKCGGHVVFPLLHRF